MGFFKNLKSGMQDAMDAAKGVPQDPAKVEAALASLSPEQRAAYDEQMARVAEAQAESQASYEHAKALSDQARIIKGPAGDALYGAGMGSGPDPAEIQRIMESGGGWREVNRLGWQAHQDAKAAHQEAVAAEVHDPAERARVDAAEREARAAARAPYLAASVPQVAITRISTRGKSQVAQVAEALQQTGLAGRPDLVYGVYRVPDKISPTLTPQSEKGRVVEWDLVHWPFPSPPAGDEVATPYFPGTQRLVRRRFGEEALVDEEVGGIYLQQAGIAPEACFGVARVPQFRELKNTEEQYPVTIVDGMAVFHHARAAHPDAAQAFVGAAPHAAGPDQLLPAHVEILEWAELARVVVPKPHLDPPLPSHFPYLPNTPQELLVSYLQVVGVAPSDCWSAQVTVNRMHQISAALGLGSTNVVPKRPCQDGKPRGRISVGEVVIVAYRDRPEYVAGRERWAAYQEQVLQARLTDRTGRRATIEDPDDVSHITRSRVLGKGLKLAEKIGDLTDGQYFDERPPPYRYQWPPER